MAGLPERIGHDFPTSRIRLQPLQSVTVSDALAYRAHVSARAIPLIAILLMLSACEGNMDQAGNPVTVTQKSEASPATPDPAVTSGSANTADEGTFWLTVEAARKRGAGDPDAMAEALESRFAQAADETLRAFQRRFVEVSGRLYTWQHWNAAEMICGFVSDDVFTDWRSWVISLGRDTFVRVAEDPDNLADVANLSGGCEAGGEIFGSAVSGIYFERHGFADEAFPILEPFESPRGEQVNDPQAIRRAMPGLAARIPEDGLGRPPRTFE
jgi:hypothetical protein